MESGNLEIDFPLTDANFADDYTTAGRVPVRPTPDDLPQFRRETQALGINLGHRLRAALEATREGLRANRRFVLPGAQHFKIADPMFNREGDLLVRLTPEGG